ncbi:acetylcholinesterase-1-like [Dermacentor andersoni]|uniref:acetylcholinesterase-1-like n=1 Tax=Dermacentor andersoni TaxID=34620 RepID=UPI0021559364|nr:acetylcholinesterase-1-like [Dermacentor andersoni]
MWHISTAQFVRSSIHKLIVLVVAVECVCFALLSKTTAHNAAPVVRIGSGLVSGLQFELGGKILDAYIGIPYAQPPVGELRFKKPRPVSPWDGIYNATTKPTPCHQVPVPLLGLTKLNYTKASEDCLYVNVWKPSQPGCREQRNCTNELLPVLVYFHGGAFQWGDSALLVYDPANFVALTEIVFVTFNYRLGIFGFLSLETSDMPSNVGLWDQHMVLEWVRENIASFGGDPRQVTIGGQSAGATSVALHAASPRSKGLFKRIITQSGSPLSMVLNIFFRGEGKFINTAVLLGCYDVKMTFSEQRKQVISCLRKLDASFIMRKVEKLNFLQQIFSPFDKDEFLPFSVLSPEPWKQLHVEDVLLGTTTDEGTMFFSFLSDSFPQASEVLATQYRTVVTVVISQAMNIPVSTAKELVLAYFGGHEVEHSYNEVRDIICEIFADAVFNCPTQLFADSAAEQGIRTHRYLFAYKSTHSFFPKWMGVAHTEDLFYTMGSLPFLRDKSRYTDVLGSLGKKYLATQDYTSEEEQFMKDVVSAWGAFVRTGKPTIPRAGVIWPLYGVDKRQMLVLRPENFTIVNDMKTDRCAIWRPIFYRKDAQEVPVTSSTTAKTKKHGSPPLWKTKYTDRKPENGGSTYDQNLCGVFLVVLSTLAALPLSQSYTSTF